MASDGGKTYSSENILLENTDVFSCVLAESGITLPDGIMNMRRKYFLGECEDNEYLLGEMYSSQVDILNTEAIKRENESYIQMIYSGEGCTGEEISEIRHIIYNDIKPLAAGPGKNTDRIIFSSVRESIEFMNNILSAVPSLGEFVDVMNDSGKIRLSERSFTLWDEKEKYPDVYLSLTGMVSDIEIFVHEFSHAYGIYKYPQLQNELSSEIIARLSEYYIYEFLPEEIREEYINYHTRHRINHLLLSSAVSEFEEIVYTENLSSVKIIALWRELAVKYGIENTSFGRSAMEAVYNIPGYYLNYLLAGIYSMKIFSDGRMPGYEDFAGRKYNFEDIKILLNI